MCKLCPRINRENNISIITIRSEFPVLYDNHINLFVCFSDHLVMPFSIIYQIYIGVPQRFGRCWHVTFPGEDFSTTFWCIYNQWTFIIIPIANFFTNCFRQYWYVCTVHIFIQRWVPRILLNPRIQTNSKNRVLIVTSPLPFICTWLTNVSSKCKN